MIYSYSRLSLFQQCPFRFYLKYIEGREEPVTKPLALGKAVHKAIERLIEGARFKEAVLDGWAESDFHPEVGREELEGLVRSAPVSPGMGEAEVHFCLPLDENDPFSPQVQGYIDLVQDGLFVDWKTNWRTYHVLDNMQLSLYAWALMKMQGIRYIEGKLYFLRFGQESGHVFDEADAERARQWAWGLAREIEDRRLTLAMEPDSVARLFPPRPSSLCSHCPFVLECYQSFGIGYI